MAHARARKLKTGTWWYMVPDDRRAKPEPCGKGRPGKDLATRWAAKVNELRYLSRSGLPMPVRCVWTLWDLRREDLAEAKRRGLRTVLPQRQGKQSRRESHWNNLLSFFGADTNLDDLSQGRIREYIRERGAAVGPAAINRDLWGVLRPALRLARDTEAAYYQGDPFRGLRKLDERAAAKKPIALSEREAAALIRCSWTTDRELGAHVELLYETASRLNEEPEIRRGVLHYPAYKRGEPRSFPLDTKLRQLMSASRFFRRPLWLKAVAEWTKRLPEDDPRRQFRPHWIRHTRLTIEGGRPGADLAALMRWGGWKTAAMADAYLHPHGLPVKRTTARRRARRRNSDRRETA